MMNKTGIISLFFIGCLSFSGNDLATAGISYSEEKGLSHIRVGIVRDKATDEHCGVELQFSRDFKAKRYSKYAFKRGAARDVDDRGHVEWRKYAVMHLDGEDRFFQLVSEQAYAGDKAGAYEILTFHSAEYDLKIKWLLFDICDQAHHEDCEVEGLRAYITIRRGDARRNIRLFGMRGC